jgi:bla regulator protein BlaR1
MNQLFNHLWQSTLFVAAVALACLALRRNSPRLRHWLWLAASLKFLVPFSPLVSMGARVQFPPDTPSIRAVTVQEISTYFAPVPAFRVAAPARSAFPWPVALGAIWIMGTLFLLFRWFRRWRVINLAARNATQLPIGYAVPVLSSRVAMEPGAFGIFRPVILLPEGIVDNLTPEQFETVIAHELRHISYRDNLTAALHMFVETMFWFHPVVWWIGAKLMEERERDCDEAVLRQGNLSGVYARSIVHVCETYVESPLACAAGISGSDLKKRIREIMAWHGSMPMTFRGKAMLAAATFAAVSVPFVIGVLRAQSGLPEAAAREFDVASIKPYLPQGPPYEACNPRIDPTRLSLTGCTLKNLIRNAYDLKGYQVPDQGPDWTNTDRYVIEARTATPATKRDLMRMLQPMLAARFGLQVHWELRQGPVYFLNVASHGLKLPPATKKDRCGEINIRPNSLWADCDSMDGFAYDLQELVKTERPVINRTGLSTEQYEIKMDFSLDDDPAAGPSLFSALPAQLGLTLTSGQAPVRKLVLDRVQRPTPN